MPTGIYERTDEFKKNFYNPERNAKISKARKGKPISEAHRQNIIKSLYGNKRAKGVKRERKPTTGRYMVP